jgi:hypothetical protein
MKFNEAKFLEKVQKIHLKEARELGIYKSISDAEVRKKLEEFICYDKNPRVSVALDEICKNIVGNAMFKIFMTKMITEGILKSKDKIKIVEQIDKKKGSRYSPDEFEVKINFDRYDPSGTGKPERQYYCLHESGEIQTKLKSLAESLFHEFCHALHDMSEIGMEASVLCLKKTPLEEVWGDYEELRTITCFNSDPICDHCFDFYQAQLTHKPFHPRYAHNIGYRSWYSPDVDKQNREKLLRLLSDSQKFMDGWKEYVL